MQDMEKKAEVVAKFLAGMANEHRLLILCHLIDGEKSVTQLIELTGIAQTSMSQHLSKLKNENMVTFRREHRTLYYSIDNSVVLKIMNLLHGEFCK